MIRDLIERIGSLEKDLIFNDIFCFLCKKLEVRLNVDYFLGVV